MHKLSCVTQNYSNYFLYNELNYCTKSNIIIDKNNILPAIFNEKDCMEELTIFINYIFPCLKNFSCNSNDNFYFNVKKDSNVYIVII